MKGRWSELLLGAALLLSLNAFAENCGVVPAAPQVKRSFKMTVFDSTKNPEAGVKVTLGTVDRYHAMHPISVGVTDKNGVLNFVKISAGQYTLRLTDATGERQLYNIEVSASGQDAVEYTWPYVLWIPVRSASGILMHDAQPMRHYKVTLLGYPDGNDLGVSDTDLDGRFDLPAVDPGRYYVDIARPDETTGLATSIGRIPINVTMDNRYPAVEPIFIAESACGLTYDRYCSLPPAKLAGSCIRTVAAGDGKVIVHADVSLKATHGAFSSTSWSSDADGNVKLPSLAAGDYELKVIATGHTPVRQTITLVPGETSCNTAIVIPMYEFGSGCVPPTQRKVN